MSDQTFSLEHIDTPTGAMRTLVFAPVPSHGVARRHPGLVLYSEIFQLTAPVRRLAVQLAGLGYLVMAVVRGKFGDKVGAGVQPFGRRGRLKPDLQLSIAGERVRPPCCGSI